MFCTAVQTRYLKHLLIKPQKLYAGVMKVSGNCINLKYRYMGKMAARLLDVFVSATYNCVLRCKNRSHEMKRMYM